MKKKLVLCALMLCVLATLLALPAMAEECPEGEHDFAMDTITTLPTCTEAGKTVERQTCKKCGKVIDTKVADIAALDHDFAKTGEVIVAETCTTPGTMNCYCKRPGCNEYVPVQIPASHKWAPHTGSYYTDCGGGKYIEICSVCAKIKEEILDPRADHIFDVIIDRPATCTDKGEMHKKCKVCGHETTKEEVAALGHQWKEATEVGALPATCETPERKVFTCTRCGKTKVEDYGDPLGHDEGEEQVLVEPNCGTWGTIGTICKRCGKVVREDKDALPPIGHEEVPETLVAPTCTTKGKAQMVCRLCAKVTSKPFDLAATGHSFDNGVVTKPTCEAIGSTLHTCKVCGYQVEYDFVPKLDHQFEVVEVIKPTCTEKGYSVVKCKDCGYTTKADEGSFALPPVGHKWKAVDSKPATCTEEGNTKGEMCKVCGVMKHGTGAKIDPLGHKAGEKVVVAATCTKKGSETVRCTVCNEIIENKVLDALGHMFSKDRVCIRCGYNVKTDKMPSKPCDPVAEGAVVNAEGKEVKYTAAKKNGVQTVTVTSAKKGAYTLKLDKETLDSIKKAGTKEISFVVGDVTLSIPVAALKNIDLGKGEIQFQVNGNKFAAQTLVNGVIADQTEAMTKAGVVVK